MLAESPMRPSTPKASAASLPPPLLRLLPGGANQFPGGFNSRCGPPPFTAHPVTRLTRSCVVDACFLTADVSPHRPDRFLELGTEHIRDIACFGAKAHRRHWPSGAPEDVPSRNSLVSRAVAVVAAPAIGPLHTSSCAA